jgi:hypothetical protein
MHKIVSWITTGIFLLLISAPLAHAAEVVFIAGNGSDASNCLAPATACRNFDGPTGAFSKVDEGGVIMVLPGEYQPIPVDKSMSIVAVSGQVAGSQSVSTIGDDIRAQFIVNAGATDVVRIRGFVLGRVGLTGGAIALVTGGALYIEDCILINGGDNYGIQFEPSGTSELYVKNTTITDNGNPANGGGLRIRPNGSGSAKVVLDNVSVENNASGIEVDGRDTSGAINVTVSNSVMSGSNTFGLRADESGAGTTNVLL